MPQRALRERVRARLVRALLEEADFAVEEHILRTREEVEAYKKQEGVATTPQIFVDGKRVGGADDLEAWLAHERAS